jgi:hypothetical protein
MFTHSSLAAEPAAGLANTQSPSNHTHSARALAAMLLAAIVSALVVAADALIDSYADGHLLFAWSALWAVGFASMALFADSARSGARKLLASTTGWRVRYARRSADNALMAAAQRDPRIMADLHAAIERADCQRQKVQLAHGRAWLAHRPVGTLNAGYTGPRSPFKASPLTGLPLHLQYLPR